MNDKKARQEAEKVLIAECGPCCNNPPKEPYYVDTNEEVVAVECSVPECEDDNFDLYLKMDAHVETAAKIGRKALRALLTATGKNGKSVKVPKISNTEDGWDCIVVLDYPMGRTAAYSVNIPGPNVTVGEIVWAIAQAYTAVYSDPKKNGIWGHAMGDLYIEYVHVDTRAGIILPGIGS